MGVPRVHNSLKLLLNTVSPAGFGDGLAEFYCQGWPAPLSSLTGPSCCWLAPCCHWMAPSPSLAIPLVIGRPFVILVRILVTIAVVFSSSLPRVHNSLKKLLKAVSPAAFGDGLAEFYCRGWPARSSSLTGPSCRWLAPCCHWMAPSSSLTGPSCCWLSPCHHWMPPRHRWPAPWGQSLFLKQFFLATKNYSPKKIKVLELFLAVFFAFGIFVVFFPFFRCSLPYFLLPGFLWFFPFFPLLLNYEVSHYFFFEKWIWRVNGS